MAGSVTPKKSGCGGSSALPKRLAELAGLFDLTPAAANCCAACGLTRLDEVAIDCKLTTAARMAAAGGPSTAFISGPPTTGDGALPPFRWSTSPFAGHPHAGQPDLFDFDWLDVN